MKSILSLAIMLCSFSVYAEADVATAKAEMTAHLDQRITNLQEAKTCIASAATKEDMKKCHAALKEDRMEMRADHASKKAARIKARQEKATPGAQ